MERRELLKLIAVLTGGAVIGGDIFLSGCKTKSSATATVFEPFPWPKLQQPAAFLKPEQLALLDEVGETIVPATTTPGAKAAEIGKFMNAIVADCYTEAQQAAFVTGLTTLNDVCAKKYTKSFMEITPQQRHDLLVSLEKEAKTFNAAISLKEKAARDAAKKANTPFVGAPLHYYSMMKQLTLWGYFTSKPGMTEALRHVPVPGKYDGNFPYAKGDRAFSL
jgi:Gluconate 2-dehydrogenase subunit 3